MLPPVSIPVYLKRQCLSTNFKNTQDKNCQLYHI
nr:MAG TPA: hypothetical protein [Caudoviricetes sp.]